MDERVKQGELAQEADDQTVNRVLDEIKKRAKLLKKKHNFLDQKQLYAIERTLSQVKLETSKESVK